MALPIFPNSAQQAANETCFPLPNTQDTAQRLKLAEELLKTQQYWQVYKLVASNPLPTGDNNAYLRAEWLAGFVALTKLQAPLEAIHHFWNILVSAQSLRWQAKAAFWLGLAYEAAGDPDKSLLCFYGAAEHATVFYGQLAQIFLQRMVQTYPPRVLQKEGFTQLSVPDPFNLMAQLYAQGFPSLSLTKDASQNEQTARFLLQYYNQLPDYGSKRALLESLVTVDPFFRVRLYKRLFQEFQTPSCLGYPLLSERLKPEQLQTLYGTLADNSVQKDFFETLAHAIILCESEFNVHAKSTAGARGMMQLMPGTANDVYNDLVKHHLLASDDVVNPRKAVDNVILGSAHLRQLFAKYGYNPVLIAAAYNAGSHRVDQWIRTYGDPRDDEVALLEWMEFIPFRETRFYVQAVLEAFIVYSYILKTEYLQDFVWPSF